MAKKQLLITLLLLVTTLNGCAIFAGSAPASEQSLVVAERAVKTEWGWHFAASGETKAQLVFYPGGKVEPLAYATWFPRLLDAGIQIDLVDFPLDLAILSASKADKVLDDQLPSFLGGHSLGGAMASGYVSKHPDALQGLILLAAYPLESHHLEQLSIPTLSISASNDGLSTIEDIEASRAMLPADTIFYQIEGGNHAQFGDYGKQDKDNDASISLMEQHRQTAELILEFIQSHIDQP